MLELTSLQIAMFQADVVSRVVNSIIPTHYLLLRPVMLKPVLLSVVNVSFRAPQALAQVLEPAQKVGKLVVFRAGEVLVVVLGMVENVSGALPKVAPA
ncbi:MAG: hypothetical protein E6P95_01565 [Candidatus Moraniibacteriota bacterium]|nr:MAG: hypothetical protein E6P95_01565 [Candidatus Moranbacteria bacterium]